jgi:hypothetical protein
MGVKERMPTGNTPLTGARGSEGKGGIEDPDIDYALMQKPGGSATYLSLRRTTQL